MRLQDIEELRKKLLDKREKNVHNHAARSTQHAALESVHIKRTSKIIASWITEINIISNLS